MRNPLRRKKLDLDARFEGLNEVLGLAEGRLAPDVVALGRQLKERADQRLKFGSDVTVVALAGATGSGKSSLFNELIGLDLSETGVRRPMTSEAHACVWGEASADLVLEWLDVPHRHHLDDEDSDLDGLVLLDLPDHDSTERSHRVEVDRLAELVDLIVWVLDPQKYADAAVHDRYLKPLAGHSAVMLTVLNQTDRLNDATERACLRDLRRLLKEDGLETVRVMPASARTGRGVEDLREMLRKRVAARRAASQKLAADIDMFLSLLDLDCEGTLPSRSVTGKERTELVDAMADAAGVHLVADAVDKSFRRDAVLATGWPFTRWVKKLRPHPLGRLRAGASASGGRTSLPPSTPVQKAKLSSALRRVAEAGSSTLPDPWPALVRRVTTEVEAELPDRLDNAVASAELGDADRPGWWAVTGAAQYLLAGAVVVGLAWLVALYVLEWLQIPEPPRVEIGAFPLPTLFLLGGLLAGFLLSAACKQAAKVGALRRKLIAQSRIRASVEKVAMERVVGPIEEEMATYERICEAAERASGRN